MDMNTALYRLMDLANRDRKMRSYVEDQVEEAIYDGQGFPGWDELFPYPADLFNEGNPFSKNSAISYWKAFAGDPAFERAFKKQMYSLLEDWYPAGRRNKAQEIAFRQRLASAYFGK